MTPRPLSSLSPAHLAQARVLAADIDGTLTTQSRIEAATVADLCRLRSAGLAVVLVTGRSAGWAAALAAYLPCIQGVVAENGAVLVPAVGPGQPEPSPLLLDEPGARPGQAPLEVLDRALAEVLARYPAARPGADNFCRLSDRTVEVGPGISPAGVREVAARHGLAHTHSTVHHHLSASHLDKRSGLLRALARLALAPPEERAVLTVGDSANDRPLFAPAFALSVGVSGVLAHLEALEGAEPSYVTAADGGAGFSELVDRVVGARRS